MKSSFELAMERLEKESPTAKLTEQQKAKIAEIDATYKARIAERELFLRDTLAQAQFSGRLEEAEQIEQELARDVRRLIEECEAKKNSVRGRTD